MAVADVAGADLGGLAAAAFVAVLPGSALLASVGVARPRRYAALAVPLSLLLVSATGDLGALVGVRAGPLPVGVVTGLLLAAGAARAVRGRTRTFRSPRRRVEGVRAGGGGLRGLVRRVPPTAAGGALVVVGAALGVVTWWAGTGSLATYPQEHDMIFHLALTAYVARTGDAAAWHLAPTDVLTGSGVTFYPAGFHVLAAVVTRLVGDPVVAVNALTVVLVGVGLPVGTALLTTAAGRWAGLGRATATAAGGLAAVLVATLYRPAYQLAHDGGILPFAVSLALAPAVLAALLDPVRPTRREQVLVGAAAAGLVAVHPSVVATLGVTAVGLVLGELARASGRRRLRAGVPAALRVGGTAAVLSVPTLVLAASAAGRTTSFDSDVGARPVADVVGRVVTFAYGGFLDPGSVRAQVWAAVLVVVGALAVLLTRRGLGLLAAWGAWLVVVVGAGVASGAPPAGYVTGLLYNAEVRMWSEVSLVAAPLAGVGLALGLRAVLGRRGPRRVRALAAPLALVAVAAGYLVVGGAGYARTNADAVASRYEYPDFVRVDDGDRRAAAWLSTRVGPGQRVLNSANDGSTFLYTRYGVPVVNLATLGSAAEPATYHLLARFDRFPTDPAVRRDVRDLAVGWVYVDHRAPPIGTGGAPRGWAGPSPLTVPAGLRDLDGLPGLTEEFRSGSVSVYRVDPAVVGAP